MAKKILFALMLLGVALYLAPQDARTQQGVPSEIMAYADMIFHNGKVLLADDSFTVAQAIAIRGDRILATGSNDKILAMAGPKTQRFDLAGRTVTPGFIDTHFHLNTYAFYDHPDFFPVIGLKDLGENKTKERLLEVVRDKSPTLKQQTPPGEWIVITDALDSKHGIIETLFGELTAQELDAIFPDHPVALGGGRQDVVDEYTVNTRGLEIFKAHASPMAMKGVELDPKTNEPTGGILEPASAFLDYAILPFPDVGKTAEILRQGMLKYNALGLTTICTKTPPYQVSALRELWVQDRMTMRWRANIETFLMPDTEETFKLVGNITDLGDPMLKIRGAYVPGVDGHYPWVWQPGEKLLPGVRGVTLDGQTYRTDAWKRPDGFAWHYQYLGTKYGWNMTGAHNQGDRGADALLSAIEAGKKDQIVPNSQQTFAVDHGLALSQKTPEGNAWERMKNVNMIPSLGMPFLFDPPKVDPKDQQAALRGKGFGFDTWSALEQRVHMFGRERVSKMLPAKSMIRAGLKPVAESDRGVLPECCPLWNLEKMVTRRDDRLPGIWGADERVTREEALLMYTNWAAYYTGDEKWLGTLEPGKLADLVVIDGDYLTVPEDKISDLGIAMTVVNGKIVYSSDKLSGR